MRMLQRVLDILRDERGFIQGILPWLLGLTAVINYGHRQAAQKTLGEDVIPPEQIQGSVIQGFANRGLNIGPQSPVVQEALRRQSLAKRQQKAQLTLSGPDPLFTLFNIFGQN